MDRVAAHNDALSVVWVGSSSILGPEQHKVLNGKMLSVGQGNRDRHSGRDGRELHFTRNDEQVNRNSYLIRAYIR